MMSAARSVPRSSMIERWTSASRCSSASAARSSSSDPTTRAASCAESSLMMSASSLGCSRASRCSLTDSWIWVGFRSCSGATLCHAISERGTRSSRPGSSLPAPSRRSRPPTPIVGGDDAQRAAGARDLDVVDAHDLAAVDVDDLLVEQVVDQIQRLVVGRAHDLGRRRTGRVPSRSSDATSAIGAASSP